MMRLFTRPCFASVFLQLDDEVSLEAEHEVALLSLAGDEIPVPDASAVGKLVANCFLGPCASRFKIRNLSR